MLAKVGKQRSQMPSQKILDRYGSPARRLVKSATGYPYLRVLRGHTASLDSVY